MASRARLANGAVAATDAVVVTPRMVARSAILESFGLEPVVHPLGAEVGSSFDVTATGQTSVAGVWATGNAVDISRVALRADEPRPTSLARPAPAGSPGRRPISSSRRCRSGPSTSSPSSSCTSPPSTGFPLFRRCVDAVARGGTLLIVAHHPSDMDTTMRRPRIPDAFYTADQLADLLEDDWTVIAGDARPRAATDPDGDPVTIHDTVFVARRVDSPQADR